MDFITIPGFSTPYILNHLSSINFEGMPPVRNIREVSPAQAGTRIVNTFYDERAGSLTLNVHKEDKQLLLNIFSPDRHKVFDEPFVYNKELLGGVKRKGNDGETVSGSGYFFSPTGRFVDYGGLTSGSVIIIGGTEYAVSEHVSDSILLVDGIFGSDATSVEWSYISATVYRTLKFYVDGGFVFGRTDTRNTITSEVLDIIAGNPFWTGYEQTLVWGDIVVRQDKVYPMQYPQEELYSIFKSIQALTVYMSGDIAIRPTIRVDGFMTIFRLDNFTQGTFIEYSEELAQGTYVIIDLRLATATLFPSGENVLRYVKGDITTFQLLPFIPNDLQVNTDAITLTSLTSVTWRNLYLGSQHDRL